MLQIICQCNEYIPNIFNCLVFTLPCNIMCCQDLWRGPSFSICTEHLWPSSIMSEKLLAGRYQYSKFYKAGSELLKVRILLKNLDCRSWLAFQKLLIYKKNILTKKLENNPDITPRNCLLHTMEENLFKTAPT